MFDATCFGAAGSSFASIISSFLMDHQFMIIFYNYSYLATRMPLVLVERTVHGLEIDYEDFMSNPFL